MSKNDEFYEAYYEATKKKLQNATAEELDFALKLSVNTAIRHQARYDALTELLKKKQPTEKTG